MEDPPGIEIPPDQLGPETLRRVIEEFVTRDGTELTDSATKVEQVEELLRRGEVGVWFDPVTQTCNLLPRSGGWPAGGA